MLKAIRAFVRGFVAGMRRHKAAKQQKQDDPLRELRHDFPQLSERALWYMLYRQNVETIRAAYGQTDGEV